MCVASVEILAMQQPPEAVYTTVVPVHEHPPVPVIRLNNSTRRSVPRKSVRKYFTEIFHEHAPQWPLSPARFRAC